MDEKLRTAERGAMKTFIRNAEGQKLSVVVEQPETVAAGRLVFIQHGLSSFKEYYVIRCAAEVFLANGYTVVTFDSRYSFGESDGDLIYSTLTAAVEDLETVIDWAKSQDFYAEPFALCGHSLGGGSALYYAERHPERVDMLVPLGAMVGGKYYLRSYILNNREFFEKWRETGRRHCRKQNDKSVEGWVSFDFVTDLQNYDMVFDGGKIKAATLLVTGEKDLSSTVYNNERMYAALTAPKELVVIKDCPHTFDSDQNRKDLCEALDRWLKTKV